MELLCASGAQSTAAGGGGAAGGGHYLIARFWWPEWLAFLGPMWAWQSARWFLAGYHPGQGSA